VQVAPRAYRLCRWCAERQGAEAPRFEVVQGRECYVCGGAMDRTSKIAKVAARRARSYQYKTFAVGVSSSGGVQEREDELRSDLKLKGNETIKTQVARIVAAQLSDLTGKSVDKQRPDLALLVDFETGNVTANSKPVFFYGRYAKPAGIPQRRLRCEYCRGVGCKRCRGTGFEQKPSVEELLRKKLVKFTGAEKVTFMWLGSEDSESRVYSPGRPFVAEVKNPRKRKLPARFGTRFRGGIVSVASGRVLPSKPVRLPGFRFLTRIRATAASRVSREELTELRSRFRMATVRFERPHNRPAMKMVYRVAGTARGMILTIDAELDGGLPVKRLVSGELVSPSVSEVLKTEVRCRSFDICRVRETGEFGFAEVARDEEKN
jgi:tRNA pseudouridine synthase 10